MIIYLTICIALVGLAFGIWKSAWVSAQSSGDATMQKIAGYIADGALSFLKAEYKALSVFVVIVAILLALTANDVTSHWLIAVAFVLGASLSALAGLLGMRIATKANVRTAEAARTSLTKALNVSFSGGMVMGINVVSLGLLGICFLLLLFLNVESLGLPHWEMEKILEVLIGFSLGAESIALFARVGGGIYTKAADVGADIVGKVEAGIPEDDPRNPAVIADNVGDNVGDVAGMGADLFGSYVSTILATMVLGLGVGSMSGSEMGVNPAILLPLGIASIGVIASILASFLVKVKENGNPQQSLNIGNYGAVIVTAIASYFLTTQLFDNTFTLNGMIYPAVNVFYSIILGHPQHVQGRRIASCAG